MDISEEKKDFAIETLERRCSAFTNLMVFLVWWLGFQLFFWDVWPEGWAIDWIQGLIRECVAVVFHGHLAEWQQRVQVSELLLVIFDAVLRGADKVINLLLDLALLSFNFLGQGVSWEGNLQSFVLLLEVVDHSSDGNRLLVGLPVDLWWGLGVGEDTKKSEICELCTENCYLISSNQPAQIFVALRLESREVGSLVGWDALGDSGPVDGGLSDTARHYPRVFAARESIYLAEKRRK